MDDKETSKEKDKEEQTKAAKEAEEAAQVQAIKANSEGEGENVRYNKKGESLDFS